MCSPAVRNCFNHDQNSHSPQHVFTDLPLCMVRAICLWQRGYFWLYGITCLKRLQTKKMTDTVQVHSQIGEVEEQGGKFSVRHYDIIQKVHDKAGMGTHATDLFSNSLSLRENNATAAPGCALISSFFCALTSVFSRDTTARATTTRIQLIFSSENKGLLDLDRNQRGGQIIGS